MVRQPKDSVSAPADIKQAAGMGLRNQSSTALTLRADWTGCPFVPFRVLGRYTRSSLPWEPFALFTARGRAFYPGDVRGNGRTGTDGAQTCFPREKTNKMIHDNVSTWSACFFRMFLGADVHARLHLERRHIAWFFFLFLFFTVSGNSV